MDKVKLGVWIWGTVGALVVFVIASVFIITSFHVDTDGVVDHANNPVRGAYVVIKENQTMFGAVLAVLGVVWSWFFKMSFDGGPKE